MIYLFSYCYILNFIIQFDKLRQRKITKEFKTSQLKQAFAFDKSVNNSALPDYVGYGMVFFILIFLRFFYAYENFFPSQLKIQDADSHPERLVLLQFYINRRSAITFLGKSYT